MILAKTMYGNSCTLLIHVGINTPSRYIGSHLVEAEFKFGDQIAYSRLRIRSCIKMAMLSNVKN